jgi:hypothetical protein
MSHYELELRIQWTDPGKYVIAGRYIDPDQDSETELIDRESIAIDHAALRAVSDDPDKYGAALSQMVFGSAPVLAAYQRARDASGARDGLRIRLHIQRGAPELHALRWELMHEPGTATPLFWNQRVWFSRFLSADELRLGRLHNPDRVQVLVAVANPTDVETKWQHPPIDVAAEYQRAEEAVVPRGGVGQRVMTARRLQGRVSIYDLVSSLRDDYAEVLYLVAHGSITPDGAPYLLLEGADGAGEVVAGQELVDRLVASGKLPRLIVLASCKSGGGQGAPGLVALAPRLARAGVPHVIAMQGEVSIESMQKFMPRLFSELAAPGQIARAVAAARAEILDAPDWWMPVLYTHSKRGMVWPPRSVDVKSFQKWNSVVMSLQNEVCLPVLGPGLVESVIGSTRDMARDWAERYEIPLARNRDDIAQVAQHLAYQNDAFFVRDSVRAYVTRYLRKRFHDKLTQDLLEARVEKGLVDRMISLIGKDLRASNPNEVHTMLARMPVPIYISANRDNLLFDALEEQGKKPRTHVCTWESDEQPGPQLDPTYVPSVKEPLVFYVFGNFKYPDRLIITEDDYFEFLMGVTRNETREAARIPPVVSAAIANSGWLMLGFQVEDWDFRVVLSSVLRQPGRRMGQGRRTSVAIQMNMTDEGVAFERTCDYLGRYFSENKDVTLFWSSPEAFVNELMIRYEQAVKADRGVLVP